MKRIAIAISTLCVLVFALAAVPAFSSEKTPGHACAMTGGAADHAAAKTCCQRDAAPCCPDGCTCCDGGACTCTDAACKCCKNGKCAPKACAKACSAHKPKK